MRKKGLIYQCLALCLAAAIAIPPCAFAQEEKSPQEEKSQPVFKQEELDQLLAPISLYPDSLVSQILMASTYPLEVVMAGKWVEQNKDLKDDALATALEQQTWDPSVKSLVNFPQVLDMMNQKLDWTQKLGDAFLAQQKDVLDTIQKLRAKANEAGNLKTTKEQVVKVEKETIIIESASPQVIYVPSYDPFFVYGPWWYPAYPPYYYYPPGYYGGSPAFYFAAGIFLGAAWGYAWGGCNWHDYHVDIDINRHYDINHHIDRSKYEHQYDRAGKPGRGGENVWQHDPSHRKGVTYRDQGTAQKYNRASTMDAAKSREAFRGRAETGRQDLGRGSADQFKGREGMATMDAAKSRESFSGRTETGRQDLSRGSADQVKGRQDIATMDAAKSRESFSGRADTGRQDLGRGSADQFKGRQDIGESRGAQYRSNTFEGIDRGGSSTREFSSRGETSRSSMSYGGGGYGGGGMRGGGRSGGRR